MRRGIVFAACIALAAHPAFAQRANESAATSADDAFGTSVGNESIGLYSSTLARGFSPTNAGNVRIDGLYFDQQAKLNNRIVSGSTIHVGISTQAYAFPAPTGIADFHLRVPGDKRIISAVAYGTATGALDLEVDSQLPIVDQKLSLGLGASIQRVDSDVGVKGREWTLGAVARWNPGDDSEVIGFWSTLDGCDTPSQHFMYTTGHYLPPEFPLHEYFSQDWAIGKCRDTNFGALARYFISDAWTFRAGVFRSFSDQPKTFYDYLYNVTPTGAGEDRMVALGPQTFGSYSGDLRLSNTFTTGKFRHKIDFALRGRDVRRAFGSVDVRVLGPGAVGVKTPVAPYALNYSPNNHHHSQQGTGGVSYNVAWTGVGELTLGLQKTFYGRTNATPGQPTTKITADPLLYNAAASVFVNQRLAFYGSYTRGLEESGSAAPSAVNRGEAMPSSITRQVDAGFRFIITPTVKFVAGVFDVSKPYFNTHPVTFIYGPLGDLRHRGIEVSLSGQVIDGLTVVSGLMWMKPRISGDAVNTGVVAPIAVGPIPWSALLNLTYAPQAWRGFSIDTQINTYGAQVQRADNGLYIPRATIANVGARYNFRISDTPASARLQAFNVTNAFAWTITPSGAMFARSPRSIRLTLAADF